MLKTLSSLFYFYIYLNAKVSQPFNICVFFSLVQVQGGQSHDTHVVISHVLFNFFARFKVRFTIIFLFFGSFQKCHLVQSTQTRKLFLMALKF